MFYLPKVGDYVVHETHGIGKCKAIKKMNFGITKKENIKSNKKMNKAEKESEILRLQDLLNLAVENLDFEQAIILRDTISELKNIKK